MKYLTGLKVREALQQRMKQQHEREWGNTHASLSAAAAAPAAAAVVWGWTAISRLQLLHPPLSSPAQVCCWLVTELPGPLCFKAGVSCCPSGMMVRLGTPRRAQQLVANWLAQKTCGECVCRRSSSASRPAGRSLFAHHRK